MIEKIALLKKLISEKECQDAVEACKESENYEDALKEYFVSNHILTFEELSKLIDLSRSIKAINATKKFGDIAVKMGFITQKNLDEALAIQRNCVVRNRSPRRIGQILLESGKLTKKQIEIVINEQRKKRQKPELFEPVGGGILLKVNADKMSAYLKKTKEFDDTITADDIRAILLNNHIQYGVESDELIEGFINSSGFEQKPFKITSGKPKADGKDAKIKYHFNVDYLKV